MQAASTRGAVPARRREVLKERAAQGRLLAGRLGLAELLSDGARACAIPIRICSGVPDAAGRAHTQRLLARWRGRLESQPEVLAVATTDPHTIAPKEPWKEGGWMVVVVRLAPGEGLRRILEVIMPAFQAEVTADIRAAAEALGAARPWGDEPAVSAYCANRGRDYCFSVTKPGSVRMTKDRSHSSRQRVCPFSRIVPCKCVRVVF
jgi:hypothetical protein